MEEQDSELLPAGVEKLNKADLLKAYKSLEERYFELRAEFVTQENQIAELESRSSFSGHDSQAVPEGYANNGKPNPPLQRGGFAQLAEWVNDRKPVDKHHNANTTPAKDPEHFGVDTGPGGIVKSID